MILDEITLHDFGVYAKQQTINLTPPSADKPITLFGGLNGAGKTTILDAMQLCLHGQAAQLAGSEGRTYQENVVRRINKHSRWRQSSVSLVFRRTEDGEEARYRVTRTWRKTATGLDEKLDVSKNKNTDKALAKNWMRHVEEILPANIARLFFFDGEKIEAYASPENSRALVQTAIHNLLGLDTVEQLQKDLKTLERRWQAKKMLKSDAAMIADKQAELDLLLRKIAKLKEDQAQLRSRKIDPVKRELAKAEQSYKEMGGDLRDQRNAIERTVRDAETALAENSAKMLVLADSQLPLLLAQNLLNDVKKLQQHANKKRQATAVVGVLEKRDAKMIAHLRRGGDNKTIVSALEKFCRQDLQKMRKATEKETPIDMGEGGEAALLELLRAMPTMRSEVQELVQRRRVLVEEAENANLTAASIPPEDALNETKKNYDALLIKLDELQKQHRQLNEEIERLTRAADRIQSEVNTMWEQHAEAELAHKEKARFLMHTQGARETLSKFKRTVLHERIGRIEKLVLESYQSLLHKGTLAGGLRIDPENFDITLYDSEKHPIAPEQLSAGERQLLAISLLWGMAKASRKVLPTAIDTPLGRLDSEHRKRLVERYFGFASHQVLLFSTDEEISGDYLRRLKPWIGRFYRLDYDDTSSATTVTEGFWDDD